MMCGEWEERIALRTDGGLPPEEVEAVERHLAGCTGCREAANAFQQDWAALKAAHEEDVTEADLASVRAGVREKLEGRRGMWRWGWAGALAAAGLVLAAVLIRPADKPAPVAVVGNAPAAVGQVLRPAAGLPAGEPGGSAVAARKGCHTGDCEAPVAVQRAPAPAPAGPDVETDPGAAGMIARATEGGAKEPAAPQDQLVVKLLTGDPDVIIYWIADTRGD